VQRPAINIYLKEYFWRLILQRLLWA